MFANFIRGLVSLALGTGILGGTIAVSETGPTIALLSVQDQAAAAAVSSAFDVALRFELSKTGSVIGGEQTRDTLRKLRIRDGDQTSPETLRELGRTLQADLLVTATLHDLDTRLAPQMTVSAMLYGADSGELLSAAFGGRSGADGTQVLGLGFIGEVGDLVPRVVENLIEDLMAAAPGSGARNRSSSTSLANLGVLSVVPFDGLVETNATVAANTLTRAVEVSLHQNGARLLSPNRTHEIVRQIQVGKWGSITAETRDVLHSQGNADALITGTIESYETGFRGGMPNPLVGFSIRLLDASSGRILWTGDIERKGSSRGELFRIGRIYSRGALTMKLIENLVAELGKDGPRLADGTGGTE